MAEQRAATLLAEKSAVISANDDTATSPELEERRTPELVIGFVGPVGSGVTYCSEILAKLLNDDYGYTVKHYRISDQIIEAAPYIGERFNNELTGFDRVDRLQTLGNKLRERFHPRYLADKVVDKIALERVENGGYGPSTGSGARPALPRRVVHIVDSFKNPAETRRMRDVYGDTFWLVGVFAPEDIRKERLKEKKAVQDREMQSLLERDEDEGQPTGQRVRDTIFEADFFLRNDEHNDSRVTRAIKRFLSILFSISVETPTIDEAAMYTAVSSAANSGCLSRQVGAAIYSDQNELIGVGSNDVPKFCGGLYRTEDDDNDNRCYKYGGKNCRNNEKKEGLYEVVFSELKKAHLLGKAASFDLVRRALKKTDIKNLIEYSRAVHAEMEAIISAARAGKLGLLGSTLYCSTFPCHSCARHIIAAGIRKVVYIEPYPKSLAVDLHRDALSIDEKEKDKKVIFLQYEGIAPKNVVRFFKNDMPRKNDAGKVIVHPTKNAIPVLQPMLDGYTTREQIVVANLAKLQVRNDLK